MQALIVHGGIDVPISIDAKRIRAWTGETMGDRSTGGTVGCCREGFDGSLSGNDARLS
jgi:hypothetical protein